MYKPNLASLETGYRLSQLGWNQRFQRQLDLEELEQFDCARITEHHRSEYRLLGETGNITLAIRPTMPEMAVGDWILIDKQGQFVRLLERESLFQRKASGPRVTQQYIAANIDTVFIVCSVNDDFNLSRIERYLAVARQAQVEPVVVLTKIDLVANWHELRQSLQAIDPLMSIEAVNALEPSSRDKLLDWCGNGKTVALVGSSGVGKSTLINTLLGLECQLTGSIREDDSKGRHTTTARSLHLMPSGGVLIDTPGMRELQLTECADGVAETFSDIEQLAERCRFSDCEHSSEPGCAVTAAIESGDLDSRRLDNYRKLKREQARNSTSLAEQRAKHRQQTKLYKSIQNDSRKRNMKS
ncbi:ribosome small subunit-dependent GTPase A [Vibrio sp.]|uniref:ribosome small subunit-dependent GTPase A n=1 Tax=Vibrio sp. TaxID=678 RepID=UPI003D139208